ncbi:MAG TPA: hypothetical protein VK765_02245 [Solirubrobacteraceae bacterium]|jgi:hypothetical protein|nr:hypothetical protein [Solirubrobacteraceae bacterium]
MDPIHPITPGPMPISARLPVQPLARVSREHDRPSGERQQPRPRREPSPEEDLGGEDDADGLGHIDIRV